MIDDRELATGIGAAAARHTYGSDAANTAALLLTQLRLSAERGPLELRRTGSSALESARRLMGDCCIPHNASQATRALIGRRIEAILPDAAGPPAWRG